MAPNDPHVLIFTVLGFPIVSSYSVPGLVHVMAKVMVCMPLLRLGYKSLQLPAWIVLSRQSKLPCHEHSCGEARDWGLLPWACELTMEVYSQDIGCNFMNYLEPEPLQWSHFVFFTLRNCEIVLSSAVKFLNNLLYSKKYYWHRI